MSSIASTGSRKPSLPGRNRAGAIRPRAVKGKWRLTKTILLWTITLAFLALPLLRWPRAAGSQQAILFDFAAGRAYVLGLTFLPQDLFLLVLVLIGAALLLFLTNTLVGRIWCGFACPQTLWTDAFMAIERWTDARAARGNARLWQGAKHAAWFAIASATGIGFVGYFTDAPQLWTSMFTGTASPLAATFVFLFTATTYLLAGIARQKVCTHMCPWPRFQAAMLDAGSLSVTYRADRGEPRTRGTKRATASSEASGDCVDCGLCVAVCPMGIDIRDGLQLDCIGCGLCADACDGVMVKTGRQTGLVGFYSEAALSPAPTKPRALRIRPWAYGGLLAIVLAVLFGMLMSRAPYQFSVAPERDAAYVILSDGSIRNNYTLRLTSRAAADESLALEVSGPPGAKVTVTRDGAMAASGSRLSADESGLSGSYRVSVDSPGAERPTGRIPVQFRLVREDGSEVLATSDSYFWAPEALP